MKILRRRIYIILALVMISLSSCVIVYGEESNLDNEDILLIENDMSELSEEQTEKKNAIDENDISNNNDMQENDDFICGESEDENEQEDNFKVESIRET